MLEDKQPLLQNTFFSMQYASIGNTQGQYAPSSTDLSVSKIIFYMSAFRYNKDSTHYGDFIDQTI